MTIAEKKIHLASWILRLEDTELLHRLLAFAEPQQSDAPLSTISFDDLQSTEFDLETLRQEQGVLILTDDVLDDIARKADIQEPLVDLLKDLN